MTAKALNKLLEEVENIYDTLPDKNFCAWDVFVSINDMVSKHKGLDCLININFANGGITQGICVITDWKPGALVFQSDDGKVPKVRIVHPEEYRSFMLQMESIFDAEYPPFLEE